MVRMALLDDVARSSVAETRVLVNKLHNAERRQRSQRKASEAAAAAQHEERCFAFKAVAEVDGRLLSIYDGVTEFVLGRTSMRHPRAGRAGAFFVHRTAQGAMAHPFPSSCRLAHAPRVVLRVRCDACAAVPTHGKLMLSELTPTHVVARRRAQRWKLEPWYAVDEPPPRPKSADAATAATSAAAAAGGGSPS